MARSPGFFLLSFRGPRETLRDALLRSATCRSMELTSGMNTIIPLYGYIRNGEGKEKKVKEKKKRKSKTGAAGKGGRKERRQRKKERRKRKMQWGGNKENKRCETTDDDDDYDAAVTVRSERDGAIDREPSARETR